MSAYTPDLVLAHLARGLVELEQMTDAPRPGGLPYPESLHIGWNRLGRLMLRRGLPIPPSLPALLDLCEQPLPWPGLDLPDGAWLTGDRLLHDREVTDACIEIAAQAGDLEYDEQLMVEVLEYCRDQGKHLQPTYECFRTFLTEKLLLLNAELLNATQEPPLNPLSDYLKRSYEPVPASCLHDGQVYTCKHCGWTVTWRGDRPRCLWRECPGNGDPDSVEPIAHPRQQLLRLRPGLYRYVAVPGQAEQNFFRQVRRYGIKIDLYPDFDRWDCRLHLGDGEAWAVDVKDWGRPYWLARELKEKRRDPVDSRAIVVIPDRRVEEYPGYLNVLNNCVDPQNGLEFRSASQLLQEVEQRMGGD